MMDADDEQTMQMAADIARNRRSVDVRKRALKILTEDASSQTVIRTTADTVGSGI